MQCGGRRPCGVDLNLVAGYSEAGYNNMQAEIMKWYIAQHIRIFAYTISPKAETGGVVYYVIRIDEIFKNSEQPVARGD